MKKKSLPVFVVLVAILSFATVAQEAPTVRNGRLDATFKTFFGGDEASEEVDNNLVGTYETYGTYMAAAIIQHQIDYNIFLAFLNGDTWMLKQFPNNSANHKAALQGDNKTMQTHREKLQGMLDLTYNNLYNPVYIRFDHNPLAYELAQALDAFVRDNEPGCFGDDYETEYQAPTVAFVKKLSQTGWNEITTGIYMVAHRVYLADMMMFRQLLATSGIDLYSNDNEILEQTFRAYMSTVEPRTE